MSDALPRNQPKKPTTWMPYPLLTLVLLVAWVLLVGSVSFGIILLGFGLSWAISHITAHFWPARPQPVAYGKILAYILLVAWDIVVANIQVAMVVLFRPVSSLNCCWITIPLELESKEAIVILAGTITLTPGTVSCDLSGDGKSLLVHCLDAPDPEAVVDSIKTRYEARLKEIFP